MVASYHTVPYLQCCSKCLGNYEQCCIQLLKVLDKHCNADILGVLLIYPHYSSGGACLESYVYISVKPLTVVVLQYITVCMYICMHVCMYVIHTYICMCIYIYVHIICINHVSNHYFIKMRLRYNYNRYTYLHASTHIHAHHYWQIHTCLSVVT